MVNVKTYAYGFPRIGKNREYKKTIEKFWTKKITQEEYDQKIAEATKEYNEELLNRLIN